MKQLLPIHIAILTLVTAFAALAPFSSADAVPYPGKFEFTKTAEDFNFGTSVDTNGTLTIIGARFEDGDGLGDADRGAAYVYDNATGAQLFELTASDTEDGDEFGYSVAIHGNIAIVGAPGEDGDAGNSRGAAYVFDLATGIELFKLSASDTENFDEFGYSVAIHGNIAIVGAPGEDGDAGNSRGAAYVFDLATGIELFRLSASDTENFDFLGRSVAIHGNIAIVGASGEDGDAGSNRGAAYVFDLATGIELFKLSASDTEDLDGFGFSVAIHGNIAIVGAQGEDGDAGSNRGAAYVFDLATGIELFKLSASDTEDLDGFGISVAIHGNIAIVGAQGEDGDAGSNRGAAYVFDLATGIELFKLSASDTEDGDGFGRSVAIHGNTAIVGAPFKNTSIGAAYAYHIPNYQPDNWIGRARFTGAGNNRYNTSGAGQQLNLVSRSARPVKACLTIENDGDVADHYSLQGTPGNSLFAVTYFRHVANQRINNTAAILTGTHRVFNVGEGDMRSYEARIVPNKRRLIRKRRKGRRIQKTTLRKTFVARLTTTSEMWDFRKDAVNVRVQTR